MAWFTSLLSFTRRLGSAPNKPFSIYRKNHASLVQFSHEVARRDTEIKSNAERARRNKDIRNCLTQFLKEGQDIQHKWEYSNFNAPHEKQEWESRVDKSDRCFRQRLLTQHGGDLRDYTTSSIALRARVRKSGHFGLNWASLARATRYSSESATLVSTVFWKYSRALSLFPLKRYS